MSTGVENELDGKFSHGLVFSRSEINGKEWYTLFLIYKLMSVMHVSFRAKLSPIFPFQEKQSTPLLSLAFFRNLFVA